MITEAQRRSNASSAVLEHCTDGGNLVGEYLHFLWTELVEALELIIHFREMLHEETVTVKPLRWGKLIRTIIRPDVIS